MLFERLIVCYIRGSLLYFVEIPCSHGSDAWFIDSEGYLIFVTHIIFRTLQIFKLYICTSLVYAQPDLHKLVLYIHSRSGDSHLLRSFKFYPLRSSLITFLISQPQYPDATLYLYSTLNFFYSSLFSSRRGRRIFESNFSSRLFFFFLLQNKETRASPSLDPL